VADDLGDAQWHLRRAAITWPARHRRHVRASDVEPLSALGAMHRASAGRDAALRDLGARLFTPLAAPPRGLDKR